MLEDGSKKTLGAGSHMLAAAEAGLHISNYTTILL